MDPPPPCCSGMIGNERTFRGVGSIEFRGMIGI